MNQTLIPALSKSKEAGYSKKLDSLLERLRKSNRETLEIYKDINKLRRTNETAFNRAKKAVEALERS